MKLSINHILPYTYLSFTKDDFIKEDFIFILKTVIGKSYIDNPDIDGIVEAVKECISKPEVILILVRIANTRNIDVIGIID